MKSRSLIALLACFAATAQADVATPTRAEVMEIAASFADYRWEPTVKNVRHGRDAAGIDVQTPDRSTGNSDLWQPGEQSVGVPYKWGGFDSLASFARGVRAGKAAGDLYNAEKRRKGGAAVSAEAVGVDCSGFISRCWKLDEKKDTGSLAALCTKLNSCAELRPGDVLNAAGGHVVLFVRWVDATQTRAVFYEAEPFSRVRASERVVPEMIAIGYVPLRYRKIRD
jgi:cell wall-associated NlpC family hydrolase